MNDTALIIYGALVGWASVSLLTILYVVYLALDALTHDPTLDIRIRRGRGKIVGWTGGD